MSTRQIIRFAIFHIMSRARVSVKFDFRSEKLSFNLFDDQFDDWMFQKGRNFLLKEAFEQINKET